jgi:aryl-alcohol dehydrogenase-like predicted oxidoreductase
LKSPEGKEQIRKVKELTKLAEEGKGRVWRADIFTNHVFPGPELQTTVSVLALAWVARNPNTSTVILGASKPEHIIENLKAIEIMPKLTPEILHKIEKILDNEPGAYVSRSYLYSVFFY